MNNVSQFIAVQLLNEVNRPEQIKNKDKGKRIIGHKIGLHDLLTSFILNNSVY